MQTDEQMTWLTTAEVARELRVPKERVYFLISESDLPAVRLGEKSLRVSRADLDLWLEGRRVGGPSSTAGVA